MSYWDVHGVIGGMFFLIFLLIVPRLTLIVSTSISLMIKAAIIVPLGLTGWFGIFGFVVSVVLTLGAWALAFVSPKLVIAIIAATLYASTDSVLVFIAGVIAACDIALKVSLYKIGPDAILSTVLEWKWAKRWLKPHVDRVFEKIHENARSARAERDEELRRLHEEFERLNRGDRAAQSGPQSKPWYKILGVRKSDSVDVIKSAYRKKAKRLHPDLPKNKGGNPQKFLELTEAYEAAMKSKGAS
jgi:hypothetical protein